jgi:hypothetical protein
MLIRQLRRNHLPALRFFLDDQGHVDFLRRSAARFCWKGTPDPFE